MPVVQGRFSRPATRRMGRAYDSLVLTIPTPVTWPAMNRRAVVRRALRLSTHVALIALGYLGAFLLAFDFSLPAAAFARYWETLPFLLLVRAVVANRFGIDRGYWEHVGVRDVVQLTAAITVGSIAFPLLVVGVDTLRGIPAAVLLLEWLMALSLEGGVRVLTRCRRERTTLGRGVGGRRTFVLGAGAAGEQLLRQILHDPRHQLDVVGVIDDDPATHGRSLHGIPVVGDSEQLPGLAAWYRVNLVLIAIPSISVERLRQLVDRCSAARVEFKLLPRLEDIVNGEAEMQRVREVRIEDLLGREPVRLDTRIAAPDLAGKSVLITGAGGSIGSELVRQVARFNPLKIVLVERAESPLYFTHLEVSAANPAVQVVPVLASVTNLERMRQVFEQHRPDVVFHAAAYKHVPMLEWNVVEGVWNNVFGTLRAARCAAEFGTRKFVLISTDKAVNPCSILGVTKRLAERIVRELPSLRASTTDFRVVRFGNVLGSDGSVVPLFKRQLAAGGPLTVTHPEVRRYFMTISEAVQLVLEAAALPEAAGRIAILEMGEQLRILDLAEQMIRLSGLVPHKDVAIEFTGLRPGEKLLEELLAEGEEAGPTSLDKIRVVQGNGLHGEELARRLRQLLAVTAGRDEGGLIRTLATLVPDYRPDDSQQTQATAHWGNGHRVTQPRRVRATISRQAARVVALVRDPDLGAPARRVSGA